MNYLGNKRWNKKTEDLEEYRKCDTCGVEFWAGSEWEYGNFYSNCSNCRNTKEEKEVKEWEALYKKQREEFYKEWEEAKKITKALDENEIIIKKLGL